MWRVSFLLVLILLQSRSSHGAPKADIKIVVVGHVNSGTSSTAGQLIYKLGGVDHETKKKYEEEAKAVSVVSTKLCRAVGFGAFFLLKPIAFE